MDSSVVRAVASRTIRSLVAGWNRAAARLPSSVEVVPGVWLGRDVDGAHNVAFEGANVVGRGTSFQGYDISLGRGTTIGLGCVLNGPLTIGRFTQLGSHVGLYGVDHPVDVAVPNVNRRFIDGAVKGLGRADPVHIGHGCWLGHGAVVLRGVNVGDGAIVGAGCIVTRDVPPYSVVVGVPARPAEPRFSAELAATLERSRWWTWSDERLEANRQLFLTSFLHDPDRAARLLAQAADWEHPGGDVGTVIG